MKKFYIVWNEARNEGFITDDRDDARQCVIGSFGNLCSSAGQAFAENYEDDDRTMQEIELPDPAS